MMLSRTLWHRVSFALMAGLTPTILFSQDIQWEKSYGGKHADYLFDAVPTADYGFILAGSSISDKTGNKSSEGKGNLDYWIWKMDEKGEAVWQKSLGGENMDLLHSIKLTNDGGFLLAGTSRSGKGMDKKEEGKGQNDFWIIKLDAGGGEKWQRTFGASGSDELIAAIQAKDGGYILAGTSYSDADGDKTGKNQGSADYWIIRLDASGNLVWQKTYGGQFADEMKSIAATQDGGSIVIGYSNSPESGDKTDKCHGAGDYWILKLDRTGNIEWQKTYGGDYDDRPAVVLQTKTGNYLVGGNSNSAASNNKTVSSRSGSDFWLLLLDADGNSIWQKSYDFGKFDIMTSVIENDEGTILIGGHAKSEALGNGKEEEGINDYIALKVDDKGEEIWSRALGSDGDDVLMKLIETRDGGYLLAGTSNAAANNHRLKQKQKKGLGNVFDEKQQSGASKRIQENMDNAVRQGSDDANEYITEQTGAVTDAVNKTTENDSPLKVGMNQPEDILGQGNSGESGLGGLASGGNNYKKQPASRNKSMNFGRNDFWVVKLKDKAKKEKIRNNVEAIPNPATDYTNVVIGYEFAKGTATVYDVSGRQLASYEIVDRTVPISLHGLPEGIYLVQVKTDKSTDTVKIIKEIK